ncbi:hypothetical protein WDU94_012790, partial [Cyamophila willieti]
NELTTQNTQNIVNHFIWKSREHSKLVKILKIPIELNKIDCLTRLDDKEFRMACLREMKSQLNILSRSDGSVILSHGNTVVIASMYGPVEAKIQKTLIDKASVEVVFRPKTGLSFVQDRLKESVIKSTCESALLTMIHPRTSVILTIQELQDEGSLLACCINAACLALINSGISMRFTIAAVSCIINVDNEIILDANHIQSNKCRASMSFVFDSQKQHLVTSQTGGNFSKDQYDECLIKCREASKLIFEYYKQVVKKYAPII